MSSIPKELENLVINNGRQEFDVFLYDKYGNLKNVEKPDYKLIGTMVEAEVAIRCENHGWRVSKLMFGEATQEDFSLHKSEHSGIRIPSQIRTSYYNEKKNDITVNLTCIKDGRKSIFDSNLVKFLFVRSPYGIYTSAGQEQGMWIIPMEEVTKHYRRSLSLNPHKAKNNSYKLGKKIDSYFEAWHLLDEYLEDMITSKEEQELYVVKKEGISNIEQVRKYQEFQELILR